MGEPFQADQLPASELTSINSPKFKFVIAYSPTQKGHPVNYVLRLTFHFYMRKRIHVNIIIYYHTVTTTHTNNHLIYELSSKKKL